MRIPIHHVQREAARWTIYAFKPAKRGTGTVWLRCFGRRSDLLRKSSGLNAGGAWQASSFAGHPRVKRRPRAAIQSIADVFTWELPFHLIASSVRSSVKTKSSFGRPKARVCEQAATTNLESQDCLKTNRSVQWACLDFGIRAISRVRPS